MTIVEADPAAARRISVRAASVKERQIVRRVLALLGARPSVRAVWLEETSAQSALPTITVEPRSAARAAAASPAVSQRLFEATVVGYEISRRLPRYRWLTITGPQGDGTALGPPLLASTVSARQLGESVRSGATAAGLSIRSIRVYALPVPAVETVIRLRDDQLFDDRAHHWVAALDAGPAGRVGSGYFVVEDPSGVAISLGGHVGSGGFIAFGGQIASTPIPKSAPAALYRQPTRLTITLQRPAFGHRPETDIIWTLDCQHRNASTFRHPRATCDRIIRDRWALFTPQTDTTCGGGSPGGDTIRITGQFAGHTIDYSSGGCDAVSLNRWEQLLNVTPPTRF